MLIRYLRREMRPFYDTDDTGGTVSADAPQADAPSAHAPADPPADDFDKERAMATIRQLRQVEKEAKARLKRLDELEAAEAERVQEELSQAQKLEKELAALKQKHEEAAARLRRATLKDAALDAAQRAGLTFAPGALADAVALGVFDELEVDDDGKVAGAGEAVRALHKVRPYLFAQPSTAPDINAGARGSANSNGITDEERKRISRRYELTF